MLTTVEYIYLKKRQFSGKKMLKYVLIYKPFNKPIYLLRIQDLSERKLLSHSMWIGIDHCAFFVVCQWWQGIYYSFPEST